MGYSLEATDAEVDAARFERAVTEGRTALEEGHAVRAVAVLADALGSGGGPPRALPRSGSPVSTLGRLEELRLAAIEARVDAELASATTAGRSASSRR